jgi:hypothetical protein
MNNFSFNPSFSFLIVCVYLLSHPMNP